VYGIIRQSGGHIDVHSEPGRGSAFRAYLPRLGETVQGAQTGPAEPRSSRTPETVLLVEDEEMVRTLAATILRQRYTVLEAGGGDEALRLAQQYAGPIHLLVSDVRMPGLSGPQLVERLRPLRPGLKALFISGYPDDALLPQRLSEPGTAFLPKPFSPEALEQTVRELLDQ
jgi:CheY-like chemotaxis protein